MEHSWNVGTAQWWPGMVDLDNKRRQHLLNGGDGNFWIDDPNGAGVLLILPGIPRNLQFQGGKL